MLQFNDIFSFVNETYKNTLIQYCSSILFFKTQIKLNLFMFEKYYTVLKNIILHIILDLKNEGFIDF